MTYCFDLDGTLCTNTYGEYSSALPLRERILVVNSLYDEGHRIIVNTARGSKTGIDWYSLTKTQLEDWNLKFHELYVGDKIDADLFIDDKALSDRDFFKDV
jgi:hypothetical protein